MTVFVHCTTPNARCTTPSAASLLICSALLGGGEKVSRPARAEREGQGLDLRIVICTCNSRFIPPSSTALASVVHEAGFSGYPLQRHCPVTTEYSSRPIRRLDRILGSQTTRAQLESGIPAYSRIPVVVTLSAGLVQSPGSGAGQALISSAHCRTSISPFPAHTCCLPPPPLHGCNLPGRSIPSGYLLALRSSPLGWIIIIILILGTSLAVPRSRTDCSGSPGSTWLTSTWRKHNSRVESSVCSRGFISRSLFESEIVASFLSGSFLSASL